LDLDGGFEKNTLGQDKQFLENILFIIK